MICSRDRPDQLDAALVALAGARRPDDAVIVVDSASRGPATEQVAARAGALSIRCEQPGASRARNAGWRAADVELVAFTDDDCRPAPGWTAALADAFDADDVGFVFGRVRPGAGHGPPLSVFDRSDPFELRPGDPVRALGHGANMAVRREALASIGGFDEVLGAGAPLHASEDKDVFLRALDAGWRGRYVPDAVVEHPRWRGRGAALRTAWSYGIGEGALLAKLRRTGIAHPELGWAASLGQAGADLRAGYQLGALMSLLRAGGSVIGATRGRRWAVAAGRYVP